MSPSSVSPQGPLPDQSRKCVLLVDDEFLIRLMLSEELRDAGYQVIEACNAAEALAILQTVRPDLIITDVRMPGDKDGLDVLARVRDTMPTLPVIVISGHLLAAQAMSAGATQFVAKPYLLEAVTEAARAALAETP